MLGMTPEGKKATKEGGAESIRASKLLFESETGCPSARWGKRMKKRWVEYTQT